MRTLLVLLLAMGLLGGCADDDDDNPADATAAPTPAPAAVILPDNITDTHDVLLAQDVGNFIPVSGPCSNPTSACFVYEFTVPNDINGSVDVAASLSWGSVANDFDLYLVQNGEQVAASGDAATTSEGFATAIGGGTYEFWVVAWLVGSDTYQFDATFSHLPPIDWEDDEP